MSVAIVLPMVWAVGRGAAPRGRKPVQAEMPRLERVRATPEMAFYRKYTEGMLRRYMKMSTEAGRVPSMMGREIFRGRVTHYVVKSFEDVVIFVRDVERCLEALDATARKLVTRIGVQGYTQEEVAEMLGMSVRSVRRRYAESLDELTAVFLERRLLEPAVESALQPSRFELPLKSCQGSPAVGISGCD